MMIEWYRSESLPGTGTARLVDRALPSGGVWQAHTHTHPGYTEIEEYVSVAVTLDNREIKFIQNDWNHNMYIPITKTKYFWHFPKYPHDRKQEVLPLTYVCESVAVTLDNREIKFIQNDWNHNMYIPITKTKYFWHFPKYPHDRKQEVLPLTYVCESVAVTLDNREIKFIQNQSNHISHTPYTKTKTF